VFVHLESSCKKPPGLNITLSNPKQPSGKKVCGPQEGHCEKRDESKVVAKK